MVEEKRRVLGEVRVAGEKPQVRVDAGRLRVVVAGAEVNIAPDRVVFVATHDERDLAVRFEADEAENDVNTGFL